MSFWNTPRSCCNGKQMLVKIPKASKSIKANQSTVTMATSADFPALCDFIHETCWHQLVDLVIWSTDPRSRATAAVCWNSLELCHWILWLTEAKGYPETLVMKWPVKWYWHALNEKRIVMLTPAPMKAGLMLSCLGSVTAWWLEDGFCWEWIIEIPLNQTLKL